MSSEQSRANDSDYRKGADASRRDVLKGAAALVGSLGTGLAASYVSENMSSTIHEGRSHSLEATAKPEAWRIIQQLAQRGDVKITVDDIFIFAREEHANALATIPTKQVKEIKPLQSDATIELAFILEDSSQIKAYIVYRDLAEGKLAVTAVPR